LVNADEPYYNKTTVNIEPKPLLSYNSMGSITGDPFEIYRNNGFVALGIMKAKKFKDLKITLGSEPHYITQNAL